MKLNFQGFSRFGRVTPQNIAAGGLYGGLLVASFAPHLNSEYIGALVPTVFSACSCIAVCSAGTHYGLQVGASFLPKTTLEFHPMIALKRFYLPCIPFGLAVFGVRLLGEKNSASITYISSAMLVGLVFDGLGATFRTFSGVLGRCRLFAVSASAILASSIHEPQLVPSRL